MVKHDFYLSAYHGRAISEQDWPVYEGRAQAQLSRYKRIYSVATPENSQDAESMAICAMAEQLQNFDLIANGEGGVIQSASIGSVSTSFGTGAQAVDISPAGQSKALYRAACLYLEIYRGVCG